jgi:Mlc titration factor MtfA (ptsG expression regulator)
MKSFKYLIFLMVLIYPGGFKVSAQDDDRGYIVKAVQCMQAGVVIDKDGVIVFLSRLYNEKEFNSMKEEITKLLK